MKRVKELNNADRPRERLLSCGPKALADHELLAILLGSGGKENDVLTLSKKVLAEIDTMNLKLHSNQLMELKGIGPAKAATITAALEFSRRRISPEHVRIREPQDILPLVQHLADRRQETFICITLNGAHEVIASRIITVGLVNACQVHPREVFADAITDRAAGIVVAHNHPSGDLTPSEPDRQVTKRLMEAAEILGIKFLDHVIFSYKGYYSFTYGRAFLDK